MQTIRRIALVTVPVLAASALATSVSSANAASTTSKSHVSSNTDAAHRIVAARQKKLGKYLATHPHDVVGYAKLAKAEGASSVRVTSQELGLYGVSPETYQAAYNRMMERAKASPERPSSGIPANAFTVDGSITYYPPKDVGTTIVPEHFSLWGEMDVNTGSTYQGAGSPDDVSALATKDASCWKLTNDATTATWFDGNKVHDVSSSNAYRYEVAQDHSTWKIQDQSHLDTGWIPQTVVTGWEYWPANGGTTAASSCRAKQWQANYFYDHNQGGGSTISIGVSILKLTVGYSGSGQLELKKSSGIMYGKVQ